MAIKLKVAEAEYADVGRGIARIDNETMDKLGVSTGDIINIGGKNRTAAVVWRSRLQDEGAAIIRVDGILRKNSGVSLGDFVEITKADAKPAKSVLLAPVEKIFLRGDITNYFKQRLMNKPAHKGDLLVFDIMGQSIPFVVANTSPKGVVYITSDSEITISEKPMKPGEATVPGITYEDIGGLREEIKKIREMVELPMKHPILFQKLGIDPPKGVLLYGPPGTGKTLLARAVANETNSYFITINGPEIMSKYYGESEKRLREIFEEAEKNSPAIVFIDEMDAIAPKREEVHGEVERRVVSQLLTVLDGLQGRGQVIVLGATNLPDSIDSALRRPGRFDREIEIGVPDRHGRFEVMQIHTRGMPLTKDVDLERISELTNGFTGADLSMLTKEAAIKALRRILPDIIKERGEIPDKIPMDLLDKIEVSMDDFMSALLEIEPSGMRDALVQIPNVRWDDVGGLDEAKKRLMEGVEWPLKFPKMYDSLGIEPPKGVLVYGPPGTGKTMIAKAVANEANANFIAIKGPELLSKWVGESERAIRKIFKKARQMAPSIIFFDEIDSIAVKRGTDSSKSSDRVLNQLLTELDGIENLRGVVVLAATNRPDLLDSALLRPGRFDNLIYLNLPDVETREKILKVHTSKTPLSDDVDFTYVAKKTEKFTGADLFGLSREAIMIAVRAGVKKSVEAKNLVGSYIEGKIQESKLKTFFKGTGLESDLSSLLKKGKESLERWEIPPENFIEKVTMGNFREALLKVSPSLSGEELKFYEELRSWGNK
ncbi:MAG: CDC48 family AAA ATPase [Candidatus Altiarchaeota archaeon]|nr:CDC48 family AAA ATPase [Candidatus Altiarchaeota archaeon]